MNGPAVAITNHVASPCRFCGRALEHVFVDLGMSPLCESYVPAEQLDAMEPFYPLRVFVCGHCLLVQLKEYVAAADIFGDYAYFSSYSDSWLEHARRYTEAMIARFGLDQRSRVVELASNDGYLLQYFVARGIQALGVEPAANVAQAAVAKGVPTLVRFFGRQTARDLVADGVRADLLVANNVLAHVPDLNDFVAGMKAVLSPDGVATIEFPHLARLIAENQFDTIYHEHFSYFSFHTACNVLAAHGLAVFDVEELATHGGSLRVYARHAEHVAQPPSAVPGGSAQPRAAVLHAAGNERVVGLLEAETASGLDTLDGHRGFARRVETTKFKLLEFLIGVKRAGKTIAGYGAPGKGNTLLNYCGIRTDLLDYTVDRNPFKQGKFLPGTHVPIHAPERLAQTRPDYILILPWNLREEIVRQLDYARSWGARFVVPIPDVTVLE